jgi:hypothetical protein
VEKPIHHLDAIDFLIFKYNYNGLELEFKVKKNGMGYYLHYMRIL